MPVPSLQLTHNSPGLAPRGLEDRFPTQEPVISRAPSAQHWAHKALPTCLSR